jgi:hypothetical protein
MTSRTGRKRVYGGLAALAGCAVAALVGGCPELVVEDVGLASSSAETAAFTLAATVIVTEDDPALTEDGDLSGGRGLLGVWLPPEWEATEARIKAPGDAGFSQLTPIPDGDGHFPAPFPWVPGAWFAFASPCANIAKGIFEHQVEVDVSGPEGAAIVVLGIATALFDDAGSNGANPVEVTVDLPAGTAVVRGAPEAPASAGLEACAAILYDEPLDEDCACAAPGARRETGPRLLAALL